MRRLVAMHLRPQEGFAGTIANADEADSATLERLAHGLELESMLAPCFCRLFRQRIERLPDINMPQGSTVGRRYPVIGVNFAQLLVGRLQLVEGKGTHHDRMENPLKGQTAVVEAGPRLVPPAA